MCGKNLLGSNVDYWFFGDSVKLDYLKLLGVYRNRLLLGVVVTQGDGMQQIEPRPARQWSAVRPRLEPLRGCMVSSR